MIPATHLSRMGIYDVTIGGVEVKARVIDDGKLINAALAELELTEEENPIVGLDLKQCRNVFGRRRCAAVILCTNAKCLIIQLDRMTRGGGGFKNRRNRRRIPRILGDFLSERRVCFVSPNGFEKRVHGLSFPDTARVAKSGPCCGARSSPRLFKCKEIHAVEVGNYAARVLKKPELLKCKSLEKLGSEAGVDLNSSGCYGGNGVKAKRPKWDSEIFSEEEVLYVMHDAVACYRIVHKLLHQI
ncbi:unnamed protein product [Cuscuta epithymum]|uniref:Uncharacterized protein n=1 Tax=Cuscuta epithymum TaxID=186058 RepID=A0AAV0CL94_9ASTE|nr:unnamed protein product [Cuscuta epithymum]